MDTRVEGRRDRLVLLVDADPSQLALACARVRGLGYHTVCRTHAVEALAAYREHDREIGLVMTDEDMPGINGAELTRELHRRNPGLPVLMWSGPGSPEAPQLIQRGCLSETVSKSAPDEELDEVIRARLGPASTASAAA